MTRHHLRSQAGVGLLDVLMTLLVVTAGTFSVLAAFSQFSSAARKAEAHTVLMSMAQRDLEQLRVVPYPRLALATTPSAQAATEAPRTGSAATEGLDVDMVDGVVRAGPDAFSVQGVKGRIYRYVTWRQLSCPAIAETIAGQLSSLLGGNVTSNIADLCPAAASATGNSKRITVAIVWDKAGVPQPPVKLSTVVVDPSESVPAAANFAGLAVQKAASQLTTSAAATPAPAYESQGFQLYDTRCDAAARQGPSDHDTRDTSANGAVCPSGGSRPDLMGLQAVPGDPSDPLKDYSKDITRPAAGGLVLMRDDRAGNCTDAGNVQYANSEASVRARSLHTWATPQATAAFQIPTSGARAGLTLWVGTATQQDAPGRLCVTLRRESTGAVLGSADYTLASWPGAAAQMAIAFDLSGGNMAAGERLLLTLRVPSNAGSDLRVLYDHAAYASNLTITTTPGMPFK